uniref:PPM-type phosphatase domain-containing protein n=1 Tax=Chromera velia CCMP2878 TaxID=1169474 RepID=A0A0G4HG28_9ALVE|eukprot:Cvel_27117.t1-p1 / transcript=Cvel_27117.t1 / gene=Cvel_27117 / organism=Chromera_velia_CCMP2878 / gene_product=hypothetical protein / transcript_product=hypothetical protein / location=Cvel_scaffold3328:4612-5724(+) / protein_length=371 / sequence_SO=supercontig / SO=protein_coding / is_pseudo=false
MLSSGFAYERRPRKDNNRGLVVHPARRILENGVVEELDWSLFGVFEGHGDGHGHSGTEIAALAKHFVLENMVPFFIQKQKEAQINSKNFDLTLSDMFSLEEMTRTMISLFIDMKAFIERKARSTVESAGCTVSLVLVSSHKMFAINLGDSGSVGYSYKSGKTLVSQPLTPRHTPKEEKKYNLARIEASDKCQIEEHTQYGNSYGTYNRFLNKNGQYENRRWRDESIYRIYRNTESAFDKRLGTHNRRGVRNSADGIRVTRTLGDLDYDPCLIRTPVVTEIDLRDQSFAPPLILLGSSGLFELRQGATDTAEIILDGISKGVVGGNSSMEQRNDLVEKGLTEGCLRWWKCREMVKKGDWHEGTFVIGLFFNW